MESKRKKVGLALSGGVTRGIAHVGVLAALEKARIPIDCVAGTSAGALIGAAYCAGLGIEKIKDLAARIGWRHIASLTWPARGLFSFDKLERWLAAELGDPSFADLKLPFAAVATDLETGQPVVLREGRVAPAVRASASVPGLVTPAELNGRLLCDGGISNNLPVSAARLLGAEFVIGVDVCAPAIRRGWGALGFGLTALEALVRQAGGGLHAANCLIAPDLAGFSYVWFSRRAEMFTRGEQAVEKNLALIQREILPP